MDEESKQLLLIVAGVLAGLGLVLALLYMRQRLFTQTEPIVLSG